MNNDGARCAPYLADHLHAIWTLPEDDNDYATRWTLIKAGFSRQISRREWVSKSRYTKGERGIWQRRYWEHLIRDERDFEPGRVRTAHRSKSNE